MKKLVDIVLASYNGSRFIGEQIESIVEANDFDSLINQIIIVDDGSSDNTLEIVARYASRYKQIKVIPSAGGSLGAAKNFERGLTYSTSPYVMFCDQDDVWMKHKIRDTFNALCELEMNDSENSPCMIFTDLQVVDEHLNIIKHSFFKLHNIESVDLDNINYLTFNNIATGCTMMVNRALINSALPLPASAIMHDWWFLLVAKAIGKVAIYDNATIMYRQHSANVVGIGEHKFLSKIFRIRSQYEKYTRSRMLCIEQRRDLFDRLQYFHQNNITSNQVKTDSSDDDFFISNKIFYSLSTEKTIIRKVFSVLSSLFASVKN